MSLDPLQMLLDAARYIEPHKPDWAKAAREAVAQSRSRQPQGAQQDWSCAADFLDEIEADKDGKCRWSDVANAQTNIRLALRSVAAPQLQGVREPCKHRAIICLDGKWHCQHCGDAIEVAVAHTRP